MFAAISAFLLAAMMPAHTAAPPAITQGAPGTTTPVRSACSLITSQEIAEIVGTKIRDGEPQSVSEGTACHFRSSNTDWVNIAMGPTDAKAFAQLRKLLGTQAEIQAGVGDEAFFWGNVRIYVRVGTQSLILGFARNDQGNATTKANLLALAKLGASRLR
jgi:hypothetical protein